jgi:hypothetical protein
MKKTHEHNCGHEHGHEHCCAHEDTEDLNIEKDFDKLTMEEVVYGNQHVLNILLDLLITKGVISEQELKDKLDQMIAESPDSSDVKIELPEDDEESRI